MKFLLPLLAFFVLVSVALGNPQNPFGSPLMDSTCQDSKCNRVCANRPDCGTGGNCIGNVCYCFKHGPKCPPMPGFS